MKLTREIHFTEAEKVAMLEAALINVAERALGTPGQDEEWEIDIRSYTGADLAIVKIEPPNAMPTEHELQATPIPEDAF